MPGHSRFYVRRAPDAATPAIHLPRLKRTLCDLGRVQHLADLGTNGPMVASAGADSLFYCLFGRDAIRMAMDLIDDFPALARATLLELARLQGVSTNPRADEEPGRILHEFRYPDDPHALRLQAAGWHFPHFGAVDTTPQWIRLLGAYCQRFGLDVLDEHVTDRAWRSLSIRDSLLSALAWIVGRMDDPIGGGYVWVRRADPSGIANQVWEDSTDSYHHADGSLFDPSRPYAPVAVQGYTYDALRIGADLLERAPGPLPAEPALLRQRAERLRQAVLANFWQPALDTFAHALAAEPDGSLRPALVVASSPGHLLDGGLLEGPQAAPQRARLVARLLQPDLLAAAGIRTKSTTDPRFRAGAYHNGAVWPMDTGVIADGLRHHGYFAAADDLEQRILDSCAAVGGFPEFLRGDTDGSISVNTAILDAVVDGAMNRLEQPPQANQGWTATRVWRILRRRRLIRRPRRRLGLRLP